MGLFWNIHSKLMKLGNCFFGMGVHNLPVILNLIFSIHLEFINIFWILRYFIRNIWKKPFRNSRNSCSRLRASTESAVKQHKGESLVEILEYENLLEYTTETPFNNHSDIIMRYSRSCVLGKNSFQILNHTKSIEKSLIFNLTRKL